MGKVVQTSNCMKSFFVVVFTLVCGCFGSIKAQENMRPVLERIISINVKNEALKNVLDKISSQGNFSFSYPSKLIDPAKKTSITLERKTVREALQFLFGNTISFKSKGNYVILSQSSKQEPTKRSTFIILNGYVIDETSGEKVSSVSIYEGTRMISTVTNKYGYFSIKLDDPHVKLNLKISKQNYQDTLITIKDFGNQTVSIAIRPVLEVEKVDSITKEEIPIIDFLVPEESFINTTNIKDTIYKKYQVSFVPMIGTNLRLSGNVINDYSFNILGGYSRGTRKAELAGLFNIDREDAGVVQVAGLVNAVGGNMNGVQVGGLFNLVRKRVNGLQLSGLGNISWDTVNAFQAAGLFNFTRKYNNSFQLAGLFNTSLSYSEGVQIAGLLNTSFNSHKGIQVAGLVNTVIGSVEGVQVSALINVATNDVDGFQYSPLLNFVGGNFKGVQFSGLINAVGKKIEGVQFAPLLNYATKINGLQIGLFNFSDSCTGTPIGLLSYVHSGYHRLEFSSDEIFYLNAALRTGTQKFHNILFAGADPEFGDTVLWTFGYGLGTSFTLGKKLLLDLDLTSQQVNNGDVGPKINLINKLHIGVEYKLSNGVHINTGPVLSAQITDPQYDFYPNIFSKISPTIFYNENLDRDLNLKMWIGWKVGFRFF